MDEQQFKETERIAKAILNPIRRLRLNDPTRGVYYGSQGTNTTIYK